MLVIATSSVLDHAWNEVILALQWIGWDHPDLRFLTCGAPHTHYRDRQRTLATCPLDLCTRILGDPARSADLRGCLPFRAAAVAARPAGQRMRGHRCRGMPGSDECRRGIQGGSDSGPANGRMIAQAIDSLLIDPVRLGALTFHGSAYVGRLPRPRPTIPGRDTNRLIALLELPGLARFATTREVLSMPGKTAKVTITERQQDILRTIQNAPTVSSQLRQRAAIILLAFDRQDNPQIAAQVGLSRRQVSLWRRRWADAWDRLIRIECLESHAALRRAIEQVLRDEPRPGPPGKFTPEQIVQILAVACEPPEKSGRPITHWTAHELTDEVVKRGIVPSISVAQVGRYLREAALQPHKKRYWLNTTEKDPVQFQKQVEAVCDTYLEAPALEQNHRTHTVSSDEMTGLQALERNAPSRPMTYGQCEKIEFEYTRHGTLTLIGNFQVSTGELIAPTIGPTRTEADFASHIEQTVATDPTASWIFVVDNLNIHCSETLVRKVAQACGIEQPLGKKGVRGVLKSVASRQAFLSERSHRIRFVYTPKHSSWLNQIETIFGMIMRKVIRRGSFTSVADLRSKLLNFIEYFNRVFAKPFQWTYTGRPLRAKPAA